jgi:hypothetical protein
MDISIIVTIGFTVSAAIGVLVIYFVSRKKGLKRKSG